MPDIDELSTITASLVPLDQRVRKAAFWAVYRGETPTDADLVSRLGVPAAEVRGSVQRLLERGLITVDDSSRVTGSYGLSLLPSDHRVTFDVGDRYVWCAVDAVGIPAAMRTDAQVASRCFHCGKPVQLTIKDGEPQGSADDVPVIGVGAAGCSGRVIEDVCPMVNFFCSQEHAEKWAVGVPGARVINIAQAAELGRRLWGDINQGT